MASEKELAELRKEIETELSNVQEKIYQLETNYLEETTIHGTPL